IGKGGASHLRIRGVRTVEREHCRGSPLSVDRELLSEICGSVRVRHGAGGEQQQLAKIPRIQRQTRNFATRKMLPSTCVRSSRMLLSDNRQFSLTQKHQSVRQLSVLFDRDEIRGPRSYRTRGHRQFVLSRN